MSGGAGPPQQKGLPSSHVLSFLSPMAWTISLPLFLRSLVLRPKVPAQVGRENVPRTGGTRGLQGSQAGFRQSAGQTLTRGATPGIHMAREWPCFSAQAVVCMVCRERVLARAPTLLTRLGLALGAFWARWCPGAEAG